MSYKDKPQLKLYKYENSAFVLQAIIDDFQEVSFEHNIYEAGQFTISINYNIPNALKFERGLFVQFGSNPYDFGEILTVQDSIGEDGKGSQVRTITGYDSRYLLKRRVIKNMNSNGLWVMTDKGEIVLRNLIKDQCGSGAEAKRQLPITNVIPASESALGNEFSVSENFTNLYEVCKTVATQSEIGWRIKFDGTLTLEVYQGQDLSQTVRFDTNFESLANGEFSDSAESYTNAIYIGGKGQNDDRDIYEGEDGEPSGLDRFESWDNQSSMTTEDEYEAEALSMLTQYGQTLTMNGNGLAKCPYVFREQYDIGDIVTVAFSGKSAVAQILSITEHWTWASYDISFAFGKSQNNLSDQLQLMLRKIQEASNKTNSTDSVRWYTIPTDSAMPKADVTYNTIGFQGTCAEGGSTFTLYLDTEKTGAKTYHVYFKQLSGGNLTLTTGRSGATDLVLNSGTYVAIIYVDENGNITSQGMTATSLISTGNNQPAESGAVAGAISSEATARDNAINTAIQDVKNIMSSLPTDAVLHYSFDEVPDYPDGTAICYYNKDFTTAGWNALRGSISVNNNMLKVQSTSTTNNQIVISRSGWTYTNLVGKIVKLKVFVHQESTSGNCYFIVDGNNIIVNKNVQKETWTELSFIIPTSSSETGSEYFGIQFGSISTDNYFILESIYIGNGSYSTPVIDNANGQNNAINNGGIAIKGVSGKGLKCFPNKQVNIGNFKFANDFTVSLWVNPENITTNQQGIIILKGTSFNLRNGTNNSNQLTLIIYPNGVSTSFTILEGLLPVKWSHLVVVKNGTKLTTFLDSIKKTEFTLTSANLTQTDSDMSLNVSSNIRTQSYDDLLIFDRALTEDEVTALYLNKANTPKYYSKADWKLEQMENANRSVRTIEKPPIEESGEEER